MFGFNRRLEHDSDRSLTPRRHLSLANVAATLALAVALAGGSAYAATKIIITNKDQISKSVIKKLHDATGATGSQGAPGAQGPQGPQGPAASSVAWAEVAADGAIVQQSGGITMTPGSLPQASVYCLDVPVTVHVAVASPTDISTGANPFAVVLDHGSEYLGIAIELGYCTASTNIVVVTQDASASAGASPFNVLIN
jgi:hypothetical protein